MRRFMLLAWMLLLPLGGLYHLVAGPHHREMDTIGNSLAQARQFTLADRWDDAVVEFESALEAIPEDLPREARGVRLELAQAKMNASKLPEAHAELKALLDELLADETSDKRQELEVRESLANSQFYMTWLMRLEGLPAESWEPEIESARQNYRLLAEKAEAAGRAAAAKSQKENVEASIRLARLDLTDLQGLPLPNQ